ncbi:hypothetical protein ACHAWF_007328 [Thalassiosira exigua]
MPALTRVVLTALSALIHRSLLCESFGFYPPCTISFNQRKNPLSKQIYYYYRPTTKLSISSSFDNGERRTRKTQTHAEAEADGICGLFSLTLQELSDQLEGSGRAAAVWDCLRMGIDPNIYYGDQRLIDASEDRKISDNWLAVMGGMPNYTFNGENKCSLVYHEGKMMGRRRGQGLGAVAWRKLQNTIHDYHRSHAGAIRFGTDESQHPQRDRIDLYTIENSFGSLSDMKVSPDGTTKLLLKMKDGLEIESVIIPWFDKGFSTLCVSSQVGCRQGCTFCATGRMGRLRSLTTEEILVQVYWASKVCRVVGEALSATTSTSDFSNEMTDQIYALPKIDNVVFMGMGEPADNAAAVVASVRALTDRRMFGLAQSKITISTVAPDPSAFLVLGRAPAALAWSVHAVDDSLRRLLVPTTKHSMEELKTGLILALSQRSNKLRRTMLEVALIDNINDSDEDARLLALFSRSIMDEVPGSKVVVNIIPYNSIDHPTYRTPSMERVLDFQKRVADGGVLCYVRTTRGDEDSAACGQLATKRKGTHS